MKSIEWHKHVLWLLGNSFIHLIQLKLNNFIDSLYWIKIHLCYNFKIMKEKSTNKLSKKQKIKNFTFITIGLIIYIIFIIGLAKLLIYTVEFLK